MIYFFTGAALTMVGIVFGFYMAKINEKQAIREKSRTLLENTSTVMLQDELAKRKQNDKIYR